MANYEGKLAGAKLKVALVASRFNSAITEQLISGEVTLANHPGSLAGTGEGAGVGG